VATPANMGAPERAARQCRPYDLCMPNTTADAVATYLRRQSYHLNSTRAERERSRSMHHSTMAQVATRWQFRIRFDFGAVTLDAELLDTPTATTIRMLLPIYSSVMTWDDGIFFQPTYRYGRETRAPMCIWARSPFAPPPGPSPSASTALPWPATTRARRVPATFEREPLAT
jgi:hypothetical protein